MKIQRRWGILALAALMSAAVLASAAPAAMSEKPKSNRADRKYGLYIGFIGDPFPTLWGLNAAFNGTDFLRVTAGYGQYPIVDVKTFGFGVKGMVPGRNLSPVVGLNWAKVNVKIDDVDGEDDDVDGFEASGEHFYINGGIDWTSKGGFNIGGGFNYSLKADVGGVPYINVGAFF